MASIDTARLMMAVVLVAGLLVGAATTVAVLTLDPDGDEPRPDPADRGSSTVPSSDGGDGDSRNGSSPSSDDEERRGTDGDGASVADPYGTGTGEPVEFPYEEMVDPGSAWFREVGAEVGFDTDGSGWAREGDPNGVYVIDLHGDGDPDVLTNDGTGVALYENVDGRYERSGALPGRYPNVTTALFFDQENDGRDDLYLLSDDGSVFLDNVGGRYVEESVGLDVAFDGVRAATAADFAGDACADVFVATADDWRETRPAGYNDANVSIAEDNGGENRLFAGDCASFSETTDEAGIRGEAWSLATSAADLTGDGHPDIHVANDFNNDVLYHNDGDGGFTRRVMGAATNRNGMSSEIADVDRDGDLDLFVTNIFGGGSAATQRYGGRTDGNNLLINRGDGTFDDRAEEYGVRKGGWGWAASIADFDGGGDREILHAVFPRTDGEAPAVWTRRDGAEEYVRLNGTAIGLEPAPNLGVARLDFDRDGDLDVVASTVEGRYRLYENVAGGRSLTVDVGSGDGGTTLGTRVSVSTDRAVRTRVETARADYMSQETRLLHVGLRRGETVERVEVEWPDGERTTVGNPPSDGRLEISRDGASEPGGRR